MEMGMAAPGAVSCSSAAKYKGAGGSRHPDGRGKRNRLGDRDGEDMQFGVFDHMDNDHLPLADFFEERLKIIEMYDRAGFHAWHVAEHHATTLGMAPSPNVMLAAVAQRTKRLRFGPMVYALPLYHPLRLAEEIAMLDQMSRGRMEIGFGRGSSPVEICYFGVDPAETEEKYRAMLPRVLEALETGVMRAPEQVEPYAEFALKVHSYQKPYPPVWYGVHAVDSAQRAAVRGWNTISLDAAEEARECNEAFRATWRQEHGARPLPLMGLGRFVIVAETDEKAEAIARRAYPHWHQVSRISSEGSGAPTAIPGRTIGICCTGRARASPVRLEPSRRSSPIN